MPPLSFAAAVKASAKDLEIRDFGIILGTGAPGVTSLGASPKLIHNGAALGCYNGLDERIEDRLGEHVGNGVADLLRANI